MKPLGGHSAKTPLPANPMPLGGAIIPPKPQPQLLEVRHEVVEQSIELTPDGRWILCAQANNGFTWQVDATSVVQAAAVHHRETELLDLKEENGRFQEWLQWYADRFGVPSD